MPTCNPFVESGVGHLEMELCKLLHKTPMEIGELRKKDPLGVSFIEQHTIWEYKEKEKAYKEAERKSKSRRR